MLRSFVIVALLGLALAAVPPTEAGLLSRGTNAKALLRHASATNGLGLVRGDAAMLSADEGLLHERVNVGAGVMQQEAFSEAVSQKNHSPHGHSPHGHNPHAHAPHRHHPHGHNPHAHAPHAHHPHMHYPHRHDPFGDTVS